VKRVLVSGAGTGRRVVAGPAFHHLVHVLRVASGEELEVFDGRGTAFPATVVAVGEADVELELGVGVAAAPSRPVTMALALTRSHAFEWALEKCTELGAVGFVPVRASRCVVRLGSEAAAAKQRRWQAIADGAARQCGRADTPRVHAVADLKDLMGVLPACALLLDEEERDHGLTRALAERAAADEALALIVGPEGGWERAEVAALAGAAPVTLGGTTLRAETAAVVSLTLARAFDGALS
jgi:16S rRNA (uracil1498-N3)-methyltransferase